MGQSTRQKTWDDNVRVKIDPGHLIYTRKKRTILPKEQTKVPETCFHFFCDYVPEVVSDLLIRSTSVCSLSASSELSTCHERTSHTELRYKLRTVLGLGPDQKEERAKRELSVFALGKTPGCRAIGTMMYRDIHAMDCHGTPIERDASLRTFGPPTGHHSQHAAGPVAVELLRTGRGTSHRPDRTVGPDRTRGT